MSFAHALLLLLLAVTYLLVLSLPVDGFVAVAVEGWGRGRLIRTVDAGATWTPLVECYIDLHAVATPSPYSVVAVGDNGTAIIAATNLTLPSTLTNLNSSSSSSSPSTPSDSPYSSTYPGSYLSLVSHYRALAATANASSPNSSLSSYYSALFPPPSLTAWTPTSLPYVYSTLTPPTTATLSSLVFLTPLLGLTVGTSGSIYRTLDGGLTFTAVPSPLTLDLSSLAFTPTPTTPTSSLTSLPSSCPFLLLTCGNVGALLSSTDCGSTWTPSNSTSHNLYHVAFQSPLLAMACGDHGTLLTSTDAARTWTDISPPVYANTSFTAIAFLSPTTLFLSGSLRTLIISRDAGATWAPVPLPPSGYLERLSFLFFTPTVLLLAGRSQVYTATAAAPGVWTSGPLLAINSIAGVAVMEAGVLTLAPAWFNLSTFCGADVGFNFSVSNTGTDNLTITAVSSEDPLILQLLAVSTTAPFFPLTLTPSSAPVQLWFSYLSSQLPSLTSTYYTSLTLLTDTPQQQSTLYLSVYTLPTPSITTTSFLSQYWYVLALIGSAVSVLSFIFVRRRLKYIAKWNRRVLYEDEKIHFWGCWLLSKEMEHDSDSDFWSEEEEEEEEGEGEGEEEGEWVEGEDEGGQRSVSKDEEEKDDVLVGKRRRAAKRRSTSSQRGEGGDDDWEDDDEDDLDPDDDLGDDDNTDSSISDQGQSRTHAAGCALTTARLTLTCPAVCCLLLVCVCQTTPMAIGCGTRLRVVRSWASRSRRSPSATAQQSSSAGAESPPTTRSRRRTPHAVGIDRQPTAAV